MLKWFGQRGETNKQQSKQLWGRDFNIVSNGLDEGQVVSFVDELVKQHKASSSASFRSFLKTAVTDAEQIAASIKLKAQTEAEEEAARIIAQANREAEEIKSRAKTAAEKEGEDILSAANRKAEITEAETKQGALLALLRAREDIEEELGREYKQAYSRLSSTLQNLLREGQNIETELKGKRARLWESKNLQPVGREAALLSTSGEAGATTETSRLIESEIEPDMVSERKAEQPVESQKEAPEERMEQPVEPQKEAPEEKIEQPIQVQEEVAVASSAEAPTEEPLEQRSPEERQEREETEPAPLKQDSQTVYAGEVELAIDVPVDLKMVSKLYDSLQTIPELRILHTSGSAKRGTTITVSLEKPIPLISIISSKIPGFRATPELPEREGAVKGKPGSVLEKKKKGARRIKVALKEV